MNKQKINAVSWILPETAEEARKERNSRWKFAIDEKTQSINVRCAQCGKTLLAISEGNARFDRMVSQWKWESDGFESLLGDKKILMIQCPNTGKRHCKKVCIELRELQEKIDAKFFAALFDFEMNLIHQRQGYASTKRDAASCLPEELQQEIEQSIEQIFSQKR